jgi:rod shape-determining protein MreC
MRQLTKRQRISALVLSIIALCFITLDLGGGSLRTAHSGVRGTLGGLYRGTDGVLGPVRRFVQGVPSAGSNQATIDKLKHENAVLRGQLDAAHVDAATKSQLTRLQLAATASGYRILPVRVIALGPSGGFDWTVTIDAGQQSGVRTGQTVSDGAGLVGRVVHADASTSTVLLAADPGSGVGVRDVRTGQVGIATGNGASGFTFVPLDPTASIRVGDQLSTGPLGSTSYVASIPVGTVSAVRTSGDGTVRATVRPTVSPTGLDILGVILIGDTSGSGRQALQPGPR